MTDARTLFALAVAICQVIRIFAINVIFLQTKP